MDRFKLIDGATVVFDANGAALGVPAIDQVIVQLREKGADLSGLRIVAHPVQTGAYLRLGYALTLRPNGDKLTHNGLRWVERYDLPLDVLLLESEGGHGVIKSLWVFDADKAVSA